MHEEPECETRYLASSLTANWVGQLVIARGWSFWPVEKFPGATNADYNPFSLERGATPAYDPGPIVGTANDPGNGDLIRSGS